MDPLVTTVGFSSTECVGRKNTNAMISVWDKNGSTEGYEGATQDNQDIWKHIKGYIETEAEEYRNWFIPSRAEWGAFGKFATDQGVTTGNYNTNYGLSTNYWSSSQYDAYYAWSACFWRRLFGRRLRLQQRLCASERDFLIVKEKSEIFLAQQG